MKYITGQRERYYCPVELRARSRRPTISQNGGARGGGVEEGPRKPAAELRKRLQLLLLHLHPAGRRRRRCCRHRRARAALHARLAGRVRRRRGRHGGSAEQRRRPEVHQDDEEPGVRAPIQGKKEGIRRKSGERGSPAGGRESEAQEAVQRAENGSGCTGPPYKELASKNVVDAILNKQFKMKTYYNTTVVDSMKFRRRIRIDVTLN